MTKVFLDANVLYSNTLRSLFIWLHKGQVVEIFWSMEVWEEAFTAFARTHDGDATNKFRASMVKNAITVHSECLVRASDFAPLGLRDSDDEHVVAAAIDCNSDYLITNDAELLRENLQSQQTRLIRPDDLISDVLVKKSPAGLVKAVYDHISSLTTSKPTIAIYLRSLESAGLPKFAAWLEQRQTMGKLFAEFWQR